MSHACQFYLCTTPADMIVHVKGLQGIIRVHACSKHHSILVNTIQREFGKDKVMSENGISSNFNEGGLCPNPRPTGFSHLSKQAA